MTLARELVRFSRSQKANLGKLISGEPLTKTALGSMTLDRDDVDIAARWLNNKSAWYGERTTLDFEARFAEWNGSDHAFAFMGGRVALSACIYSLKLSPGDEVIMPGYTCVVVPNAFHYAGVKTVYSDIELDTYGLDAAVLREKITPKTRAILIHHLYGLVCRDYEEILDLAKERGLYVIEDCAHATGAEYQGIKVGNRGDVGFYSSEQSKVFNTIQGGLAVTNNDEIAEGLREYFDDAPFPDEATIDRQLHTVALNYYQFKHPQRWWYGEWARVSYGDKRLISTTAEEEKGTRPVDYGQKMPDAIAALALNQLNKIDRYNELRRETAKRWEAWCEDNGYRKPLVVDNSIPVYLRYPVLVEPEKKLDTSWAVRELGVELGVWFSSNIHPVDWPVDGCPNADTAVEQCVNFPSLL